MKFWLAALAFLLAAPAAAQIQNITRAGTVPHAAARTDFPEQVGEFRRAHVLRYGENDLSGNYDLRGGDDFLRVSVYIYPAPRVARADRPDACREGMAAINADIARAYPDAEAGEVGEAPALPETEPALRLRNLVRLSARFNSPEPVPVRRENRLYCFVGGGGWMVKYYASSTGAFDVAAAIDAFVRDGPWPGRGPASIAMR